MGDGPEHDYERMRDFLSEKLLARSTYKQPPRRTKLSENERRGFALANQMERNELKKAQKAFGINPNLTMNDDGEWIELKKEKKRSKMKKGTFKNNAKSKHKSKRTSGTKKSKKATRSSK